MGSGAGQSRRTCTGTSGAPRAESQDMEEHTSPGRGCGCHAYCTVNIHLLGTLLHLVAHLVFQEKISLTTATSCRFLDRANEMRSFRTIVRCCSLVRPQRSRSSQIYGRVPYNWDAYNRILTVPDKYRLTCHQCLRAEWIPLTQPRIAWGPLPLSGTDSAARAHRSLATSRHALPHPPLPAASHPLEGTRGPVVDTRTSTAAPSLPSSPSSWHDAPRAPVPCFCLFFCRFPWFRGWVGGNGGESAALPRIVAWRRVAVTSSRSPAFSPPFSAIPPFRSAALIPRCFLRLPLPPVLIPSPPLPVCHGAVLVVFQTQTPGGVDGNRDAD